MDTKKIAIATATLQKFRRDRLHTAGHHARPRRKSVEETGSTLLGTMPGRFAATSPLHAYKTYVVQNVPILQAFINGKMHRRVLD